MAKVKLCYIRARQKIALQFANGSADLARYCLPYSVASDQWQDGEVVNHPNKREINLTLSGILNRAQTELLRVLEKYPTKTMPAKQLRDMVVSEMFNLDNEVKDNFTRTLYKYADAHDNARTREIYRITAKRIGEFDSRELEFKDITTGWLERFEKHLAKTSKPNASAIHFRNIRAVFSYARKHDLTDMHPFDKFTIKTEKTRHRDLTADELRRFFAYQPPTAHSNKHASKPLDYALKWLDAARLMYMMRGINVVDFFGLADSDIYAGYIHYTRRKTNKDYAIKIEPEMSALMCKYKRGVKLVGQSQSYQDHKNFAKDMNNALAVIARSAGLPKVTTYSLRHSYASIMYNDLRLPMETISASLGHEYGEKTTNIYVNRDQREIDDANRKMIDYIFGQ